MWKGKRTGKEPQQNTWHWNLVKTLAQGFGSFRSNKEEHLTSAWPGQLTVTQRCRRACPRLTQDVVSQKLQLSTNLPVHWSDIGTKKKRWNWRTGNISELLTCEVIEAGRQTVSAEVKKAAIWTNQKHFSVKESPAANLFSIIFVCHSLLSALQGEGIVITLPTLSLLQIQALIDWTAAR